MRAIRSIIVLCLVLVFSVQVYAGRRCRKWRDFGSNNVYSGRYGKMGQSMSRHSPNLDLPPSKIRPSLSCLLLGDVGCEATCNIMCLLYGCESKGQCRKQMYCECNEVYHMTKSDHVTAGSFRTLSFDDLWNYRFVASSPSTTVQNKIKNDAEMRGFALALLRNPHLTGDDIKNALAQEYPQLVDTRHLQSKPHGVKSEITAEGNELEYGNLGEYFENILQEMRETIRDKRQNCVHKRRIKQFLQNVTDEDELKYLLRQIFMSGNDSLYNFARSYLWRRGYRFDENDLFESKAGKTSQGRQKYLEQFDPYEEEFAYGQKPTSKTVITKSGKKPLMADDAKEEEIVEATVLNRLLDNDENYVATPTATKKLVESVIKRPMGEQQVVQAYNKFENLPQQGSQVVEQVPNEHVATSTSSTIMPSTSVQPTNLPYAISSTENATKANIERTRHETADLPSERKEDDDNAKNDATNEVDGRKSPSSDSSTTETVRRNSDQPDTDVDNSFTVNLALPNDDSKKVNGKLIEKIIANDNLKGETNDGLATSNPDTIISKHEYQTISETLDAEAGGSNNGYFIISQDHAHNGSGQILNANDVHRPNAVKTTTNSNHGNTAGIKNADDITINGNKGDMANGQSQRTQSQKPYPNGNNSYYIVTEEYVHDTNGRNKNLQIPGMERTSGVQRPSSNLANAVLQGGGVRSSMDSPYSYYLVVDDDGNVVHSAIGDRIDEEEILKQAAINTNHVRDRLIREK